MENWKSILGYEGIYEVSNLGRVRSVDRSFVDAIGRRRRLRGKLLAPGSIAAGYLVVELCDRGRNRMGRVHCLVMEAFVGPVPDGQQVAHNDGRPENCKLTNLRYTTPAGNSADRLRHGTDNRGSKHGMHKLRESQVRHIVLLLDRGIGRKAIAKQFGVSEWAVKDIACGRNWGWLTGRAAA